MEIKDKDKVAELLRKEGYDSENVNGVVITRFATGLDPKYYKEQALRIKNIFQSIGYSASNGIHLVKQTNIVEEEVNVV